MIDAYYAALDLAILDHLLVIAALEPFWLQGEIEIHKEFLLT
jgi:hypothetical protein